MLSKSNLVNQKMEYLAVDAGSHAGTLRVTLLGCVVICLVLLVLYHVLVAKKAFVAVAEGYANPNAHAIRTGAALRLQDQSQSYFNRAGFQGGHEPPVFYADTQEYNAWSDGSEDSSNISAKATSVYSTDVATSNAPMATAKAGFAMKDDNLIQIARGH